MMRKDEADKLARKVSPGDPVQQAITSAALQQAGEKKVTVRPKLARDREVLMEEAWEGCPPWVVVTTDNDIPLTFAGLTVYGGSTREAAIVEAERIGSKWDWPYVACPFDTDGDGNCGRASCPYCKPETVPTL
jgi:hypothetical protein